MTATKKRNSKVRGLNAGDSFRRLVGRTLAQQYSEEFRAATKPYNYGLSVNSGMDAVIHAFRTLTDEQPHKVITKVDGVDAFDTDGSTPLDCDDEDPSLLVDPAEELLLRPDEEPDEDLLLASSVYGGGLDDPF